MRSLLPVLVFCGLARAWTPFKSPANAAAKPQAEASPSLDPFLDDAMPLDATPLPSPAAAAVQDPEGTTMPTSTPAPQPGIGGPLYLENSLGKHLPALFGPVPLGTTPYDGYEARLGGFVFRPAIFKWEGIVLLLGSAYIVSIWLGRQTNKKTSIARFENIRGLLEEQFAQVDPLPRAESSDSYWLWASGRRNVRSGMKIHTSLRPRGDILLQLYEVIRAIADPSWHGASQDRMVIEVPIESGGDYVFCIADKAAIQPLRERWDLSTFAPVGEAAQLPNAYCAMTEVNGVQDAFLKNQELGLPALLASGDPTAPLLESLIVSDIGPEQPSEETLMSETPLPKRRSVTVSFRLRPDTDLSAKVALALNLVDMLAKGRPALADGTAAKVAKRRADILTVLKKPLVEEKREERDAKLREVKREAEKARLAALTPKQLAEEERKLRKREQKKSQPKIVRR